MRFSRGRVYAVGFADRAGERDHRLMSHATTIAPMNNNAIGTAHTAPELGRASAS